MRQVLLKAVPTGRVAKEDEKRSAITVGGVRLTVIENDSWEGGDPGGGIRQQYFRCAWLEVPDVKWNYSTPPSNGER